MPRALPFIAFALLAALPLAFPRWAGAQPANTLPRKTLPLTIVLTGTLKQPGGDLALILDTTRKKELVYSIDDCVPRRGPNLRIKCGPDQGRLQRINKENIVVLIGKKQHVVKMGKGITQAKPKPRVEPKPNPDRAAQAAARRGPNLANRRVQAANARKPPLNLQDESQQADEPEDPPEEDVPEEEAEEDAPPDRAR